MRLLYSQKPYGYIVSNVHLNLSFPLHMYHDTVCYLSCHLRNHMTNHQYVDTDNLHIKGRKSNNIPEGLKKELRKVTTPESISPNSDVQ